MRLRASKIFSIANRRQVATGPIQWTPVNLGGSLDLWLDAVDASTITLNGSTVSQWNDKSGNGRHVLQGVASKQPTYNVAGYLQFTSGSLQVLSSNLTIPGGNNYSILCVLKDNNASAVLSEPFSIGTALGATTMEFVLDYTGGIVSGAFCSFAQTTRGVITGTQTKSRPVIACIGLSAGVGQARADGIDGTPGGAGLTTNAAVFAVGWSRPQSTFYMNGLIYEIICLPFIIGSTEFLKAEGYLAWKFNLQGNLPAGHPYKNNYPVV